MTVRAWCNVGNDINGNPHASMGWFVTIDHDSLDPNNGNHLIARYLHFHQPPETSIRSGAPVNKAQKIGEVGKTGAFQGTTPVNHLHLDINSRGIYWSPSASQTIDVRLFYPHIPFTYSSTPRSAASNNHLFEEMDVLLDEGRYIDMKLIDNIGLDVFYAWLEGASEKNVYALIEDFNISQNFIARELDTEVAASYIAGLQAR